MRLRLDSPAIVVYTLRKQFKSLEGDSRVKEKKATIKDVAREANVAVATVSRVCNRNYPVSEDVRQRVLEAIAKLQYRPTEAARTLKAQHTSLVGVSVGDLSNMFFMQMVKGIEQQLTRHGYSILIAAHEEDPEKERRISEVFLEYKVACIVTTTCHVGSDYYKSIRKTGVPVIFVDRLIDNFAADTVVEDNDANSCELVTHLLEMGHRRIAVVNGDLSVHTSVSRYRGYLNALERFGIKPDPDYLVDGCRGSSYQNTKAMLMRLDRAKWPTAIFATNNKRVEGTLRALMELDARVPDDVSVVSYGDISLPWIFSLKLTHVDQNMVRIGQKTAELVLKKIKNPFGAAKEYIIDSQIVYGNSVRDLRGAGNRPDSALQKE